MQPAQRNVAGEAMPTSLTLKSCSPIPGRPLLLHCFTAAASHLDGVYRLTFNLRSPFYWGENVSNWKKLPPAPLPRARPSHACARSPALPSVTVPAAAPASASACAPGRRLSAQRRHSRILRLTRQVFLLLYSQQHINRLLFLPCFKKLLVVIVFSLFSIAFQLFSKTTVKFTK